MVCNMQTAQQIFAELLQRFHYESDQVLYGVEDYHATPQEFELKNFSGDCEGFATWLQRELENNGIHSRMVEVLIPWSGAHHMIVVTASGEVLDNRLIAPSTLDQLGYVLIKMSGFIGDSLWYLASF